MGARGGEKSRLRPCSGRINTFIAKGCARVRLENRALVEFKGIEGSFYASFKRANGAFFHPLLFRRFDNEEKARRNAMGAGEVWWGVRKKSGK